MSILFINGKIFSCNNNNEFFQVIGIKDNTINFLGTNDSIENIKNNYDSIIDLKGKVVLPGFNDSHMHLLGYGYNKYKVDLNNSTSFDDIINTSKDYIIKSNTGSTQVLLGRGWNQDNLKEKQIPTRLVLDKISTDIPIIFTRACGHMAVCNSKAISLLKYNGESLIDDNINLKDGIFTEDALGILNKLVKNPTLQELKHMIISACDELIKNGITSVQSDDFCALPQRDCDLVLKAFLELACENKLPVRVYEQCLFDDVNEFKYYLDNEKIKFHSGDTFFKIGPLKLLLDGALGGRTALLSEPYYDDKNNYGIANLEKNTLDEFVKLSNNNSMQIAVHAIGDQAINWVLDSYENFTDNTNPLRHGIVHCQLTTQNSLNKMKNLNTLAYIQPIFLHYDLHIVEDRIGSEKYKSTYAFNTMNKLGINASCGSDAPVEHFNVFNGLHCAINRQDLSNYPPTGWLKNESLSLIDAIKAFTIKGAFASFEEDIKGSLELGKLADLIVLSNDIFTCNYTDIKNNHVLLTMVDGKIILNDLDFKI
ncbi:MAG: amidohydrolase [Clostridium sp.]